MSTFLKKLMNRAWSLVRLRHEDPLRLRELAPQALFIAALSILLSFAASGAQVEQAWSVQQTGSEAGALTADEAGNVYVASHSQSPTSLWDIVLTKYGAGGEILWKTTYDGARDRDFARAVAVKGTSVVAAGQTFNTNGYSDFITLKHDASGVLQWTARYDGPAGLSDYAVAASIDGDGNVLVAGNSAGLNSGDSSKRERWLSIRRSSLCSPSFRGTAWPPEITC